MARVGERVDGLLLRVPLVVPWDSRRDRDPVMPLLTARAAMAGLSEADRIALGEPLVQTPAYLAALTARRREAVAPAKAAAQTGFLDG